MNPTPVIPLIPPNLLKSKRGGSTAFDTRSVGKKFNKVIDTKKGEDGKEILTKEGNPIPWIDYPESGGVFVYHKTFDYPEKGFRDDFSVQAAQFAKRALISWVKFFSTKVLVPIYLLVLLFPWKYKIKILENWLNEYLSTSDLVLSNFFFEDRYYSARPKELRKGVHVFLKEIGVADRIADRFAMTFMTLIQYDTAYDYRIGDLLSETTQIEMLTNPKEEIKLLMHALAERDKREHLVLKFDNFAKFLTYTLWIPRVRKAFNKAVKAMDFNLLSLDKADRYHVRNIFDYNFFGMTLEERNKKWPPEQHLYHVIETKYES